MLCHSLRAEKRSGRVHFERLAPLGFGYFESRNTADDSCKAEEVVDGAESLDGGVKAFLHALAGGYVDGYAEDAGGGEVGGEGGDSLYGGYGNDVLVGGYGRDHLNGGFGNDYMEDWAWDNDTFYDVWGVNTFRRR